MEKVEVLIAPRERDLGGFSVRRVLPYVKKRMVGPFVFFDHMGPAEFPAGEGLKVRPHPHIHLATVTYLFEGAIQHKDSLGSDQRIEPGAINWMTAGRGIVHSERAPPDLLQSGTRLNGIQLWVALPQGEEACAPSFVHHPATTIPEFSGEGLKGRLLLGKAFGEESPVKVHSPLFYAEIKLAPGARFRLPTNFPERAFYVADGKVEAEGNSYDRYNMGVVREGQELEITAVAYARLMLIGGEPLGPRFLYWNFVSSSAEAIEEARTQWARGPGAPGSPFPRIPGDEQEHIPLPDDPFHPKGTAL